MLRISNIGIFTLLTLAGLFLGLLSFFDSGSQGIILLLLGISLGGVFLFFSIWICVRMEKLNCK